MTNMQEELLKQQPGTVIKKVPSTGQVPGTVVVPGSNDGPIGPQISFPDSEIGFKSQGKVGKQFGGILRYPYEALTDETDYLQIDIRRYDSIATATGGSIVSAGSQRSINAIVDVEGATKNELRKTKFKSGQGTILLPMPSSIQDGNSVSYASGNLDGVTAKVFGALDSVFKDGTVDKGSVQTLTKALTTAAGKIGDATLGNENFRGAVMAGLAAEAANIPLGGSLTRDAVFARMQGEIINQNVELLFNGVTLRSFKFSFKFTPRGPKEAQQVGLIINTFKRHMAAKVGGSNSDISKNFLGTPNVFELTYKRGANSHPFLHSFKQCVLTDMSVNYTGEGTYAVYDDSTPVSMVLELGFKELEPIYDADYGAEPGVGY